MEVINYNKKYPKSANMTSDLFVQSGGRIPNDDNLKSMFNWDSNYRENMCRNGVKNIIYIHV